MRLRSASKRPRPGAGAFVFSANELTLVAFLAALLTALARLLLLLSGFLLRVLTALLATTLTGLLLLLSGLLLRVLAALLATTLTGLLLLLSGLLLRILALLATLILHENAPRETPRQRGNGRASSQVPDGSD